MQFWYATFARTFPPLRHSAYPVVNGGGVDVVSLVWRRNAHNARWCVCWPRETLPSVIELSTTTTRPLVACPKLHALRHRPLDPRMVRQRTTGGWMGSESLNGIKLSLALLNFSPSKHRLEQYIVFYIYVRDRRVRNLSQQPFIYNSIWDITFSSWQFLFEIQIENFKCGDAEKSVRKKRGRNWKETWWLGYLHFGTRWNCWSFSFQ